MRADAVLLVSFGGPEAPVDVIPFLRHVTHGRGIPDSRLEEVGAHYAHFGGVSPLPEQSRALRDALASHVELPVFLCFRHSSPFIDEGVAELVAHGYERVLVVLMSAFPSPAGCRSYRDELEAIEPAPRLDVVRKYGEEERFCAPFAKGLQGQLVPGAAVAFTAHSIPLAQAQVSDYEASLRRACARVCALAGYDGPWELVWQSRSGAPHVPWLEPDIGDHAQALADQGIRDLIVVPIGFISDHVEVLWDLDTELVARCTPMGITVHRVSTPGTDPGFVELLADLVRERIDGPAGAGCPGGAGCCLPAASVERVTDKPAWLDLSCGVSAEMLLGSLVDVGVPLQVLVDSVQEFPVVLRRVSAVRTGELATWVTVEATRPQPLGLPAVPSDSAADQVIRAFVARGGIGSAVQTAEITAVCAGLQWLRDQGLMTSLHSSSIGVGAHEPTTGVALVNTLVQGWSSADADVVGLVGVGAGAADDADKPHVVRLALSR